MTALVRRYPAHFAIAAVSAVLGALVLLVGQAFFTAAYHHTGTYYRHTYMRGYDLGMRSVERPGAVAFNRLQCALVAGNSMPFEEGCIDAVTGHQADPQPPEAETD